MAAQSCRHQDLLTVPQPYPRALSGAHTVSQRHPNPHDSLLPGAAQGSYDQYLTALDVTDPGMVPWKGWTSPLPVKSPAHLASILPATDVKGVQSRGKSWVFVVFLVM